ncbi:MAG: glycosyltransferase family 2 protein [Proteobacteria bacterium]|nr:glycosyltransferase family 2 protein [Pseudomonadota bacterium]MBU1612223.1 glycosyltransferase family 2 protein [Pseudomonadota bacterium]
MGKISSVHPAIHCQAGADYSAQPVKPVPTGVPGWKKCFLAISLIVLATVVVINYMTYSGDFGFLKDIPRNPVWKNGIFLLLFLNLSVLVWRIVLVMMYRPAQACNDDELKSCTVIIPAYNEGRQVLDTLHSVFLSDYPAEKLQVICVDDGSKDDTWYWMQQGRRELGTKVELIRSPKNQGKRHALNHGFLRAKGEILVTIDSDSEVAPTTLRNMISVFCRNPRVGAVAGNVRVMNTNQGLIPKMLDVAFTYSFDFIRAAQSSINTVVCTPGALSAYDHSVVTKIREKWLHQTFMGRPANIGEDRAMTNLILKEGRLVHFQSDAVVYTNVPVEYRGLCKMLLRWARSNIRETIAFSRFGFTRFRPESVLGAQVDLAHQWVRMIMTEVGKLGLVIALISWPVTTIYSLFLGVFFASLIPAFFYLLRHRSIACLWAFPYSIFMLFCLSWVSFYALLTPHKNGWLTRNIAAPKPNNALTDLTTGKAFFQKSPTFTASEVILLPLVNSTEPIPHTLSPQEQPEAPIWQLKQA